MRPRLLWLILTLLISLLPLQSQTQPLSDPTTEDGYKPYGSFAFGDYDSVNLMNLKLDLHIPLPSFQQRGGVLDLNYQLSYTSGMFNYDYVPYVPPDGCDVSQCPGSDLINFSSTGGLYIRSSFGASGSASIQAYGYPGPRDGVINAPDGTHLTEPAANGVQYAVDGSGYTMVGGSCPPIQGAENALVRTSSGISTCNPTLPGGREFDTNGNSITVGPNSTAIYNALGMNLPTYLTDSLGRTIPLPPFFPGTVNPYADEILSLLQLTSDTSGCTGASTTVKALLWKVPAPLQQTAIYKFCYAQIPVTGVIIPCSTLASISTNFSLCQSDPTQFMVSPPVGMTTAGGATQSQTKATWDQVSVYLQSIVLPNNQAWTFAYDGTYGDLTSITSPTGGTVSYTWTTYSPYVAASCFASNAPFQYARALATRTIDARDGTGPHTWKYTQNQLAPPTSTNNYIPPYSITVSNPDGTSSTHTFTNQSLYSSTCSYYETSQTMYSAQGALVQQVDTGYSAIPSNLTGPITAYGQNAHLSVFPNAITTTEGGRVQLVEKDYDAGIPITVVSPESDVPNVGSVARIGNITAERTYDYGSGSHGPLLRATGASFLWQTDTTSSYLNAGLLNRPSSHCTALAGLSACTATSSDSHDYSTYGYDEVGSPQGPFGNQTSVNTWLNTSGGMLSTHTAYNSQGMPITTVDAVNNATILKYDNTGAYLSSVQKPTTAGVSHTDQYSFDLSGVLNNYTDDNNQSTSYYYDILGRLTSASYPDGGQTTLNYHGDPVPAHVTYTRTTGAASPAIVEDLWYDGAGRVADLDMSSDPEGVSSRKIIYDPWGRVAARSNDYRSSGDTTYGWKSYAYDVLGRRTLECEQDNGTGNTACVPGSSYKQWLFSGPTITVQDEAQNQTQLTYDGLARLQTVTEAGNQTTHYQYDVASNLSSVIQSGVSGDVSRTRGFTYDSLSRLITASNSETGVICYGHGDGSIGGCQADGYDGNGSVLYKTDARGLVTSYIYDSLNRLTSKTVPVDSAGSSYVASCYQYDALTGSGPGANQVGHVVAEWTQKGSTCPSVIPASGVLSAKSILTYDAMGRALLSQQCVLGSCQTKPFTQSQQYDLTGKLTSWKDGVLPLVFTQHYDSAGRPMNVIPSISGAGLPSVLFSAQTYNPAGVLQNWNVGGYLNFTRSYDPRLRVTSETVTH